MKYFAFIFCALSVVALTIYVAHIDSQIAAKSSDQSIIDDIVYIKDPHHDICFARYNSNSQSGLLIYIPCDKLK